MQVSSSLELTVKPFRQSVLQLIVGEYIKKVIEYNYVAWPS